MTPAPVSVRPRRLTRVCRVAAAVVVVVFLGVGDTLRREEGLTFGAADQVAMAVLGLLLAGGVLLLTRPRVEADPSGIRVRGLLGETVLPWQVVVGIRMDDGSPWAVLDLHDDEQVSLLAIQSNDGDSAVDAVVALRRLLTASRG